MVSSIMAKGGAAIRALATREIRFDFENIPLRFQRTPYRKIVNWLKVETAIAMKATKPGGYPTYMQVEPNTVCNLACPFCPVSSQHSEPLGQMSLETFRNLVDDMVDYCLLVVLWGWGEPFVNKDIYLMTAYAKQRGLKLVSSTNGEVFAHGSNAKDLVASGLDALIISIGGLTPESNAETRGGGDLNRTFSGIRRIVEEKKKQQKSTPILSLSLIVTANNEHQIPELERVGRDLGVDMVTYKKLNTSTALSPEVELHTISTDKRFQRFSYEEDGERKRVEHNRCKCLWHNPSIRFDGRVSACGYDFHHQYDLGHLDKARLTEIWHGDRYDKMRRQFREDWRQLPVCKTCTYAYEGGHYAEVCAGSTYLNDALRKDSASRIDGDSVSSVS